MSETNLDISVLYVEDELPTRDKIASILKREVRCLFLAENGKEGLALFELHHPDIVITDIKMPVMDGLEMAERIKAIDKDAHVILTTAHGEADFFMKSIKVGVDMYLLKPVDVSTLLRTLREMAKIIGIARELKGKAALLEEYKRAVDESSIVCKTDTEGRITYVNDQFCKAYGYNRKEILGKAYKVILPPPVNEGIMLEVQSTITSRRIWKGILAHVKTGGESCFSDMTIVPVLSMDGEIMEFIFIGHDVTELVNGAERLKQLSSTDILTQIYNRMAFNDFLGAELQRAHRYKTGMSLIMFDIDHFKIINDTYGHLAGDEVLKALVKVVQLSIRKVDILARWGGEEFMILAPEAALEASLELAERLRKEIEAHAFSNSEKITVSMGVTTYCEGDSADSIIKRVDNALYRAKENGRNRVEIG